MSEWHLGNYGDAASAAAPPATASSLNLSDADTAEGYQILSQFYTYASSYPGFSLSSPVDILNFYMQTWGGPFSPNAFLAGLGLGALSAGMGSSDTDSAMQALASQGAGQIPANPSDFASFLTNQATTVSDWAAAAYAAKQVAVGVGEGLEQVGTTLTNIGSTTLSAINIWRYAIYAIPAVAIWYGWKNRDKLMSIATDGLSGAVKKAVGNPRRHRRR